MHFTETLNHYICQNTSLHFYYHIWGRIIWSPFMLSVKNE